MASARGQPQRINATAGRRARRPGLLLQLRRNDVLDLRHLVGAEGGTDCVTQVVRSAERLGAVGHPQRWTRPPVAPYRHTDEDLDTDATATAGHLGANRVAEVRPLQVTEQALLGHRPQRARCLRVGDGVPPGEVPLVGRVHEQVGSRLDVPVVVENLDRFPLGGDHPEALDSSVPVASVPFPEQRHRVAVRVLRALHEGTTLGLTPGRFGDENGLAPDTLSNLDGVAAAELALLLRRPPAAELHGAVRDEVDPAPVRLR